MVHDKEINAEDEQVFLMKQQVRVGLNVSWFMSPATDIDIVFHMLIMRRSFSYQMKCHPLIRGDNMRCTHVFSGIRKWSCEEDAFHPCKEISQNYKWIGHTPGSVLLDFSGDPELAFSQFNHLSIVLMCWWTSEASTWQVTLPSLPVLQTNKPGRQSKKDPTELRFQLCMLEKCLVLAEVSLYQISCTFFCTNFPSIYRHVNKSLYTSWWKLSTLIWHTLCKLSKWDE